MNTNPQTNADMAHLLQCGWKSVATGWFDTTTRQTLPFSQAVHLQMQREQSKAARERIKQRESARPA